jgi:hypothetical protein
MHLLPISSRAPTVDFDEAYRAFGHLLRVPDLDSAIAEDRSSAHEVERTIDAALVAAYRGGGDDAAHLFLQRVLYRINRMKLFWYDDLASYDNERSDFLRSLRDRIEDEWQRWELRSHEVDALKRLDVEAALKAAAAADVDPPRSSVGAWFADEAGEGAYRRLLEIASLDGLVEASQLSRTLGGVANDIHAMLTRLLLEEYGCGRLQRKHSSYFESMLRELGMDTSPEAYFDVVPWAVLAAINHSFLLSERKRYFLRYIGGLLYTEISVPAAFSAYRDCAARLGLSEAGRAYWDLHIREDERHGRWMLHDVALPLAKRYASHAWELVLGYEQQRALSGRAGAAVAAHARHADAALRPRAAG